MNADPVPLAVDLRADALLLHWPDGSVALPATELRAACRCARCRSASSGPARSSDPEVRLTGATPIGHYALQLLFSDGHERGIYPWSLLRELRAHAAEELDHA